MSTKPTAQDWEDAAAWLHPKDGEKFASANAVRMTIYALRVRVAELAERHHFGAKHENELVG